MLKMVRQLSVSLCQWILLFHIIHLSTSATIGDGSVSLYTGNTINVNESRGSCLADGVLYQSETAIPRDHPCHYCICYQSQITCYWKQCAAAPVNCDVMEFENVCNPSLYVCDIPMITRPEPILEFGDRIATPPRRKRKLMRKRILPAAAEPYSISRGVVVQRFSRVKRGLKLPFEEQFPVEFQKAWLAFVDGSRFHRRKRAIEFSNEEFNILQMDTSCTVFGVVYNLGEVIGVASDVCMECRCAAGSMFCSPKCCFLPSPFSVGTSEGNSIFVRGRITEDLKPRHPLHYVRNQYQEGPFLL